MKNQAFTPLIIRREIPDDIPVIHALNLSAFERPGEAQVVDLLRESSETFISIVAEVNGQVVGHVLFTPVRLEDDTGEVLMGMGLAPLAVSPEVQGQGVGTILVKAGLQEMNARGEAFVVVLGHPGYYHRFGFEPAEMFNLRCSYPDVLSEAFMVKIFKPQLLAGRSGVVHYLPEFDAVT